MKPLPPDLEALMPEPESYQNFFDEGIAYGSEPEGHASVALYTAAQLREAMQGAVEWSARVCENLSALSDKPVHDNDDCAAAIRGTGSGA